ncbi:hypothetical protein B0T16DRAFT_416512 [Cercophora newfieldiana]|uniref:Microbial-type PARG catalytic domain-containing protein n=1 Tax=Cercophora newfieldiana TaxID=92897 RepID=A0AA39Y0G4_9PEZI|nr:hypothetical protein B0T16DRAFT_416512 [Cercophora newfieldiana]
MGRTQPSRGLAPAATRKDARAKKAKATINKVIPSLLSTHPRARAGIAASELITPHLLPPPPPFKNPRSNPSSMRIAIRVCDTLTAAHSLLSHYTPHTPSTSPSTPTPTTPEPPPPDLTNRRSLTCILNMASPLSPGGGFLSGATSQEESLCMRTTLLPALRDEFYRLPELSAIFTPDVLVFRDARASSESESEDLKKGERWFVDVVSCAALRGPEVEGGRYVSGKDRELMRGKMRLVMGVCEAKGVKRVVLGAWGCGAYGNPVGEVAEAWRGVLRGKGRRWEGVEEVVFAVKDAGMAERFASAFGEGLEWEEKEKGVEEEEDGGDADGIRELEGRIREMELQAEQARSPQLKIGLERVLVGLREQLRGEKGEIDRRSEAGSAGDDAESEEDDGGSGS